MRKKIVLSKEYQEIHEEKERLTISEVELNFDNEDSDLFEERTEGFLNIKNHGKCKHYIN